MDLPGGDSLQKSMYPNVSNNSELMNIMKKKGGNNYWKDTDIKNTVRDSEFKGEGKDITCLDLSLIHI